MRIDPAKQKRRPTAHLRSGTPLSFIAFTSASPNRRWFVDGYYKATVMPAF
jgi:hypothetical protein